MSQNCSDGRCSLARQGVIHNHEIESGSSEFDSVPIPVDIMADLISKEDVEWYEDNIEEKYLPESEL